MNNVIDFWPTLKRLLYYGTNVKKYLILGFTLLLFSSIFEVLNPILISCFIKHYFINNTVNYSLKIITYYLILQILAAILNYHQNIIFNKISLTVIQKLRYDVMSSTLQLPIKMFDQRPIGQFISRITNDTETIKELYDTVIKSLFQNIILILITLITMFILEWRMACIASIIFPIALIIMLLYQYFSKPILRKIKVYIANIYNIFNEIINGIDVIQQFHQEQKFRKSIKKISISHYYFRMKILKLDSFLLRPLLNFCSTLILCGLILIFGIYPIGFFEIGTLYAFITYLNRLNEPLITITSQQSIFQQAIVAGERIFEIIHTPKQQYGDDSLHFREGNIKVKNLYFSYTNNNVYVLKNINIFIPSKQFIAFVGRTGSGKSTLSKLLIGHYPATLGKICLDERNIQTFTHNVLKKNISIVQQDPIILNDTILENITLGRNISTKKVLKILKTIKLIQFVNSLPKGLKTLLGENGNILSIGQKQLLSIARTLISCPKILILDEATSNVDLDTENNIKKILSSVKHLTTIIAITHRLSTIKHADNIFVFNNGEIVESGTHYNLIRKKSYYKNMYYSQAIKN
ncbi:putative ATP transporter [Buchnera aphidicola str. Bp (Baizongia pistaciae)]|uniref:Multidrug resistance-like ATP-binding protein MdlB n=1 Tax=Buchnera aphidicola subsp. Baizongia pistaciae (strain Bp) TaxID=224915 RepID=MDLB_BUCBP|nr:ABC transporter transmembrane domain-containing protein [Buchnera aphidicola]Q89A96.1 RecName: Full=Multidrug resistance-like ATP-binding protein MdlB [Buchnera aphidicola str. Bp (Baizongia pistaciae)]AAO27134.1 putative ATP transporter [Buchnera aphidicola str. Bp (Baizongia pistaciae)]